MDFYWHVVAFNAIVWLTIVLGTVALIQGWPQ
jgi:hypothetical protein